MDLNQEYIDKLFVKTGGRDSTDTLDLLSENENEENETPSNRNSAKSYRLESGDTTITNENDLDYLAESKNLPVAIPSEKPKLPMNEINEFENKMAMKAIEHQTNFSYGFDDDDIKIDDLEKLEPKLRDAWIEMRKLDKVLKRVSEKEKQIKRETVELIKKNRYELELLKITSNRKESKYEEENTAQYLALSDLDHYLEIDKTVDTDEKDITVSETPVTPVFKTQFREESEQGNHSSLRCESINSNSELDTIQLESKSQSTNKTKSKNEGRKTNEKGSEKKLVEKKNFIKRNIQLAHDAAGVLAMTEDEKERLNQLLNEDSDKFDNKIEMEYDEKKQQHVEVVEYNPDDVNISAGDGFLPERNEQERLKQIDSVLEKRDFSRILSRSSRTRSTAMSTNHDSKSQRSNMSFEVKKVKLDDDFDENNFADKFLQESKISREQVLRLKNIDSQLETLRSCDSVNSSSRSSSIVPLIDEATLQNLLDECSMSSRNVVSLIHNHKLDTLKEENDFYNYEIDEFNDLTEKNIDENTIKYLVDQARNEGILSITATTNDNSEEVESFYEKALKELNHKPNLEIEEAAPVEPPNIQMKLPRLDGTYLTNENSLLSLRSQAESVNSFSNLQPYSESQSIRQISNSPNQLVPFLPKINSRFLPNDGNNSSKDKFN